MKVDARNIRMSLRQTYSFLEVKLQHPDTLILEILLVRLKYLIVIIIVFQVNKYSPLIF